MDDRSASLASGWEVTDARIVLQPGSHIAFYILSNSYSQAILPFIGLYADQLTLSNI
jgi:hypothetical protein